MAGDRRRWLIGSGPGWLIELTSALKFRVPHVALVGIACLLALGLLSLTPLDPLSAQERFADLVIEVIDNPDPVRALERVTYTITVRNLGPGTAQNVVLEDTQPASNTLVLPQNCQGGFTDRITCDLGDLASGESTELQIGVTVDATTVATVDSDSRISNSATVVSNSVDPFAGNNLSVVETTVIAADLTVEITDSPDPVLSDQQLTHRVTVENRGPSMAGAVNLVLQGFSSSATITPPANVQCTPVADLRVCELGTLTSGAEVVIDAVETIATDVAGELARTASVGNTDQNGATDPDQTNNRVTENTQVIRNISNAAGISSGPSVAAAGDNVYLVWQDDSPGNLDVFFRASTDRGVTFSPGINLSNTADNSRVPSVAAAGDFVYVAWHEEIPGGFRVLIRVSDDNGVTFGPARDLGTEIAHDPSLGLQHPKVAAAGDRVYVLWESGGNTGALFVAMSAANGAIGSFNDAQRLRDQPFAFGFSQIAAAGERAHVVWMEDRRGFDLSLGGIEEFDIWFLTLTDTGTGLDIGAAQQLSERSGVPGFLPAPQVAATETMVYVIWDDFTGGIVRTILRTSDDFGVTFAPEIDLGASLGAFRATIAASGDRLFIFWPAPTGVQQGGILFSWSDDGGFTFSSPELIVGDRIDPFVPFTAAADGPNVYLSWFDQTQGDFEVFLWSRRFTFADLVVEIEDNPDPVLPTRELNYTVTISNEGPDEARDVTIELVRPDSNELRPIVAPADVACLQELDPREATCLIDSIGANESVEIGMSLVVDQLTADSTLNGFATASAVVSSRTDDPNSGADSNQADETTEIVLLDLIGLEATQVSQDWLNTVTLIEQKPTYVRVHLQSTVPGVAPVYATGRLRGFRNGVELPDSPRSPNNTGGYIAADSNLAGNVTSRSSLNRSLNFRLPDTWTAGVVELVVEGGIDMNRDGQVDVDMECREIAGPVPDDCGLTVAFAASPPLDLKLLAMEWELINNLLGVPTLVPAPALEELPARLLSRFPINQWILETGAYVHTSQFVWPFNSDAPSLTKFAYLAGVNLNLALMRALDSCWTSNGCRTLYYAAMSNSNPIFFGGLATGIPGNAASGAEYPLWRNDALIMEHELGHLLARRHTAAALPLGPGPCGSIGGAPFPYIEEINGEDKATIGPLNLGDDLIIIGLDTNPSNNQNKIRAIDPTRHFELMSYCGAPDWPSDVAYEALLDAIRSRFGTVLPPSPGSIGPPAPYLILSGIVDADNNTAEFAPFSTAQTSVTPPLITSSDYSLVLLDNNGAQLGEVLFEPETSAPRPPLGDAPGVPPGLGHFVVAIPQNPAIRQVRLLRNGTVLASRTASSASPTVAIVLPNGGEVIADERMTVSWQASDADGDVLSYVVQFSADAGASWETLAVRWPATSYEIDRVFLQGTGQALVRVIASDGFNVGADTSDAPFTVANNAPSVVITSPIADRMFVRDQHLFLVAEARDKEDELLTGAALQWTSDVDGPLGSSTEVVVRASLLSEGQHVITVVATDSGGLAATASTTVTINRNLPPNFAPRAVAGTNQMVAENSEVLLDGSGSFDADGDPLAFIWAQTGGPAVLLEDAGTARPRFIAPAVDGFTELVFELTVDDGTAASLPATAIVAVRDVDMANNFPIANAGPTQLADEGTLVALNGRGSFDPDGDPLSFRWTQTGGPAVTLVDSESAAPSFTAPLISGQTPLTFELTVNDGLIDSAPDRVRVSLFDVAAANRTPVADAGADFSIDENSLGALNGSGSNDPDGDPLFYSWRLLEGPNVVLSNTRAANPQFFAPQVVELMTLVFELTVTDGVSTSGPDTVTVTVNNVPRANARPLAEAGPDQIVATGDTVMFDGSESSDPDGDPIAFAWQQISGPAVLLIGAQSATPSFVAPSVSGDTVLTFELRVSDGQLTGVDAVNVVVRGTAGEPPPSPGAGPLVNVSDSTGSIYPRVAVSGSNVYTAWRGLNDVLFSRSVNDGASFEPPLTLSDGAQVSEDPRIAVTNGMVFVVWEYGTQVLLRRSMDGGASFEPAIDLNPGAQFSLDPQIAVVGDNVHVVWRGNAEPREVFFTTSSDAGATFSAPVNLSNDFGSSETPAVAAFDENVYVVWNDVATGNYETIFRRSTDAGVSFGPRLNLSNNPGLTFNHVRIAVEGQRVYVAWQEIQSGNGEVLLARSGDAGASFAPAVNLSNNSGDSERPGIAASGDDVYLVWEDDTPGNGEIFFRRSSDTGASFGDIVNLSGNSELSLIFDVAAEGDNVYVTWYNEAGAGFGMDSSVFVRASSDRGDTFGDILDLSATDFTNQQQFPGFPPHPQLVAANGNAYVIWEEDNTPSTAQMSNDVFFRVLRGSGGPTPPPTNARPVADAGLDRTVDERTEQSLDGGASLDPEGAALSFNWIQIAGPSVTLTGENTAVPVFTAPAVAAETVLTFLLIVNDGESDSLPDAVNIIVRNLDPNQAPLADAGPDQQVEEPSAALDPVAGLPDVDIVLVTLDGTLSSDPDGDALSYRWVQLTGPDVVLTDPTSPTPAFTVPLVTADTVLTFQLTVGDGDLPSTPDTVQVQITNALANFAPVAIAGDQQVVTEALRLTLDGTRSIDPEGSTLSFDWMQTDGPPVTLSGSDTATPEFIAPLVDIDTELRFRLVVNDGKLDSAPDDAEVIVLSDGTNAAPVAYDQDVATSQGQPIVIRLSASDPDGDALTFALSTAPGNGSLGPLVALGNTTADIVYTPASTFSGTDQFGFTVNDGRVHSEAAVVGITVDADMHAPIVDLYAKRKKHKIKLFWSPVDHAVHYSIYRSKSAGGPYRRIARVNASNHPAFTDKRVKRDIRYFYVVRWHDDVGLESPPSNEVSAMLRSHKKRERCRPRGHDGDSDSHHWGRESNEHNDAPCRPHRRRLHPREDDHGDSDSHHGWH